MRRLIVTFDLKDPDYNREDIADLIEEEYDFTRLGRNAFLIDTDDSPSQVRDYLVSELQRGDKIYVGVTSSPAAWRAMSEEVSDWIHNNLS